MADYFHILDEDQLVFYFGKWILIYTSRGYKPAKHLPVTLRQFKNRLLKTDN